MADNGRILVRQADSKLKGGFFSCLAGTRRYEEAAELYQQAANQLKLAKDWPEAANCFVQCAYCAQKTGDASEEAGYLTEAGNLLSKISTSQAVEQWEQAVALQNSAGRFGQSGKLLLKIAELYESERVDHKSVKEYYKRAAEMFELDEHGKSSLTKCRLKQAEYAALDNELKDAIEIFESEGEKALQNSLTQYGAKEHFLKAGLLQLQSGDSVTASIAVERYCNLDPRFGDSREGELLKGLTAAFEGGDPDAFLEHLHAYDSVTKLDNWKTDVLLKVKELLQPSGENATEELDLT